MNLHVSPRLRVVRHRSADAEWMLAFGQPDLRLRAHVLSYCGYRERSALPLRRRELPGTRVVLIVDFGPTLRMLDARNESVEAQHAAGFVSGLYDSYALTETQGAQRGIQVDFTPLGARRFVGLPMHEIANRTVGLEELFGPAGRLLTEELLEAPGWAARFAILDRAIAARVAAAPAAAADIGWGLRRLIESDGVLDIGELAAELGYSHKHLIARFRDQVGLPPKLLARILRFNRAVGLLGANTDTAGADIALQCGYYDQAHMIRDFRQFAGSAPGDFVRRQLPDSGGTLG